MSRADMKTINAIRDLHRELLLSASHYSNAVFMGELSQLEGDILFELGEHESIIASDIVKKLGVDEGYLSRTLRELETRRLIQRAPSKEDKRKRALKLTRSGKSLYDSLSKRSSKYIQDQIQDLSKAEQTKLLREIRHVKKALFS